MEVLQAATGMGYTEAFYAPHHETHIAAAEVMNLQEHLSPTKGLQFLL